MAAFTDRIEATIQTSSNLFLVALASLTIIVAALFSQVEQKLLLEKNRGVAQSALTELIPVAKQALYTQDQLKSFLIAAEQGYPNTRQALRQLLADVRHARKVVSTVSRFVATDSKMEREQRNQLMKRVNLYRVKLYFNAAADLGEFDDSVVLPLAETETGSFEIVEDLEYMPLRDLAKFTFLASLRTDLIRNVDISKNFDISVANEGFETVDIQSLREPSKNARLSAAILWAFMEKVENSPGKFGVSSDPLGQLSISDLLSAFVTLKDTAKGKDFPGSLARERVDLFGLGAQYSLWGAARIAPFVLAGLLFVASALLRRAAREATFERFANQAKLALPLLPAPEDTFWAAPFSHVLQVVLIAAPLGMVMYSSNVLELNWINLVLPILATAVYLHAIYRLRAALRESGLDIAE